MKLSTLFLLLLLPLGGCNTINRMMNKNQETSAAAIPDDLTVSGTTNIDFQWVQVPTVERAISVRVKRPNETWVTCNTYEIEVSTTGAGGGVLFKRQVRVQGQMFFMNGQPVAPTGTQYEIRSIRTGSSGSLSLY